MRDARLALRNFTVYLLTGMVLSGATLVVALPIVAAHRFSGVLVGVALMGVLMVVGYDRVRMAVQPLVDRLLFSNRFTYLEELSRLPNDMLEFNNLHEMLSFLAVRLGDGARLDGVRILMYDPGRHSYQETLSDQTALRTEESDSELGESSRLLKMLKKEKRLWTTAELQRYGTDDSYGALEELKALKGAACFPVSKRTGILGVIVLGPKRSGESFNQQELRLFEAVRLRLENFLSQAMVVTQEALNMVKDSHDMKNDVNVLKGRTTWRAMRTAAWKMELDRMTWDAGAETDPEQIRKILLLINTRAMEWFEETNRSRTIEEQSIQRLSQRLKNWAEAGRTVSEGLRGSHPVEAVELGQAARLSVERWRPLAEKKQLALTLATGANLFVRGERGLVEQVIENLIDNAIKATAQGKVEVSCRPEPAGILLEVKDTGCGIPEGDLEKLFEKPFYQGRARPIVDQSTGVGLYLVAQYVRSLGGKVWAESHVGSGSSFFVQLPRYNQDRQAAGV